MTIPHALAAALSQMPALAELFRLFLSGKHLNRMAEPALWAELEQHEASYVGLFAALGFELRLDARGFAWFHNSEANSNIGKTSRQLALLFMVIFDAQANAGKTLQRFTDWLIDSAWLADAHALAGKLQLFAHLFQTALRPEADRNQKDLRVAARTPGTGE